MPEFKLNEAFSASGAEEYKKKGNEAFKDQNWEEAIKNYNKAISLDPNQATFYSNRAACWSYKGNHESALADANKCIERDPEFVKGFSRKGKALFDLNRLDEAEAAYTEGLAIDAANDACKDGIAAIKAAKKAARGSFPGMDQAKNWFASAADSFKSGGTGGRMQKYMMIMAGYFVFTTFMSSKKGKASPKDISSHEVAEEEADPIQGTFNLRRDFAEAGGRWLSYLGAEADGRQDTQLLLLHRTASSAEADFGGVVSQLLDGGSIAGLQLIAPDRPCHGLSPCPDGGEPRDSAGMLTSLLSKRGAKKNLAIVSSGKEATEMALALVRRRATPVHLLIVSPHAESPKKTQVASVDDLGQVLTSLSRSLGLQTAREAADALRWATAISGGGNTKDDEEEDESASEAPARKYTRLPEGVSVSILYTDKEDQDESLKLSLEDQGAEVSVRQIRAEPSEELVAEFRRAWRLARGEEDVQESGHEEEE
eukprot:TRINITY_DN67040_c0_g1_i1.p1 TRINITY_DN67040_c0_g1~~TRINITY_DN67040_c0_g1_i1.p1  ORF type:complete len:510 (-),score=127.90 TRINITY_DN67040_c0_g1_i1:94-1542(-)